MFTRSLLLTESQGGDAWLRRVQQEALEITQEIMEKNDGKVVDELIAKCADKQDADPRTAAKYRSLILKDTK